MLPYHYTPSDGSSFDKIIGSHVRWRAGITLSCHMAVVDSKVFKSVVWELAILCIRWAPNSLYTYRRLYFDTAAISSLLTPLVFWYCCLGNRKVVSHVTLQLPMTAQGTIGAVSDSCWLWIISHLNRWSELSCWCWCGSDAGSLCWQLVSSRLSEVHQGGREAHTANCRRHQTTAAAMWQAKAWADGAIQSFEFRHSWRSYQVTTWLTVLGLFIVPWTGWWALISPDGVAPSRMVGVSASVNLPLYHKVQKFSSGIGSTWWSRKKGCKTVVVVVWYCAVKKKKMFWLYVTLI